MSAKRIVVAIDGPAGAGKSTIARRIASRMGFLYIDTGAMYRAVALWAQRAGVGLEDHLNLEQLARAAEIELRSNPSGVLLNGEDITELIRNAEISQAASKASAIPGVRRALVEKQRAMGEVTSIVMEGRDIGTVVFPDAEVKIFLDAAPEIRAQRRLDELKAKGPTDQTFDSVLKDITERDTRDRSRSEAPLMQAPDAEYVDSTRHSIEQVEERILALVRARFSNGKELKK
ncbi:MAG TPA: (d)CMP kinase [Bryobacteraceae bacterium]|jgi:CMP/dCMP kinase|nr:(d)CMP kinase [Bryobacteraceae bacterium]